MKYPFNLTHKPTRHYFAGGSIYFEMQEGKLYYTINKTTKEYKFKYPRWEVKSKDQLDKLLKVKLASELPLLTTEIQQ